MSGRSIPPALACLSDQPVVQGLLARAVTEGQVSHAYLFVGRPGSGKLRAARALAQCVICADHGDGSCDECIRVAHGTHPDVRVLEPASSMGYLVEQVRELIDDVSLAPVRAASKVYVLSEAALLRGTAANALLKTLEEPPSDVVFILVARSEASVLSTIVSRCQVLPFRAVFEDEAVSFVQRESGVDRDDALVALAVTGTPERAVDFLASADRRKVRSLVVRALGLLPRADSWDVLQAAGEIADAALVAAGVSQKKGRAKRADAVDDEVKRRIEGEEDYYSSAALTRLKATVKREMSARERSGMMEALAAAESLLRDALLRAEGISSEPIVNTDASEIVDRMAAQGGTQAMLAAVAAVDAAREDLAHNVTPQLALEAMLLSIKEALACQPSYR